MVRAGDDKAAGWSVRPAGEADCDRLALVGAATFLETFAGVLDGQAIVAHCQREHAAAAYDRYFAAGARAWLAETDVGQAPIGYALVGATDLPGHAADGSDVELKRIYVLSRFHSAGVGPALMRLAVDHAAASGARRLLLGVYVGNARAIAFYRRNSFAPIAERRFRVGTRDYDDVVLARPLAG